MQRAARLQAAVDGAGRVVAEARRVEAREREVGLEAHRLPQVQPAAPAGLAARGLRAKVAHLDLVRRTHRVDAQAQVVLRERALYRLRLFRGDDGQRPAQARAPQRAAQRAQI